MKRPPYLARYREGNPAGPQVAVGPQAWEVAKAFASDRVVVPVPEDLDPARLRWSDWVGADVIAWDTGASLDELDQIAAPMIQQRVNSIHVIRYPSGQYVTVYREG